MTSRMTACSRLVSGLLLLAVFALVGCGGDDGTNSPTAIKMKGLANLFLDYAVSRNGQGPAREQDLKKHIKGLPGFVLTNSGVDPKNIDALFVSERDGEPFVVNYGIKIGGLNATTGPLVAHEKTGKNGKRLAVLANTKVLSVDDARLQELSAVK